MNDSDRIKELEAELAEVIADLKHKQRVNEELKAEVARLKVAIGVDHTVVCAVLGTENLRLSEQLGRCREVLTNLECMRFAIGDCLSYPREGLNEKEPCIRCACLTSLSKG